MTHPATTTAPTRTVVVERDLPHSPDKVWRALTEGSLIDEWLMKNDFQPVVGHRFHCRATPVAGWDGVIECQVLLVEPKTRLSYTWASMGFETVVLWTLTPTATGTSLRMEQSGFGLGADAAFKGATYGWQRFIGNLEKLVGGLA